MDAMASSDDVLDPIRSISHFAKLLARLAEPFADRAVVFEQAGTTSLALDGAETKWRSELKSRETVARLFSEVFKSERRRLNGGDGGASVNPDETAMAPGIGSGPALPFVEGEFKPESVPVVSKGRRRAALDIDATMSPIASADETLPFVKRDRDAK